FVEVVARILFYGIAVVCDDDPVVGRMFPQIKRGTVTYGTLRGSDFLIKPDKTRFAAETTPVSHFHVTYQGEELGQFGLHVPGAHNVLNATAAIAVGIGLEIQTEQIRAALENFRGDRK